jgi:hypothetical protein
MTQLGTSIIRPACHRGSKFGGASTRHVQEVAAHDIMAIMALFMHLPDDTPGGDAHGTP